MDILYIIIALIIVIGACPFIGKKIYTLNAKQMKAVYYISCAAFFGLNVLFSTIPNLLKLQNIINDFSNNISAGGATGFIFIILVISFILSGVGFFGGLAEGSSEIIEESGIYSTLQKKMGVRATFMSMFYGYIFLFGVFSINRALMILFSMSYRPEFFALEYVFEALMFKSPLILIIGLTFFCQKAFRYGIFEKEFWKTNVPYIKLEIRWYRLIRKVIVIFIYIWGVYLIVLYTGIITYNLPNPFGVSATELFMFLFYLFAYLDSIYFYASKEILVHHLKVKGDDFKKKVDASVKITEIEDIDDDDDIDDDEIKFD